MTDTKYATTSEVAKHFRISKATVLSMMRSGEIPAGTYVRTGRVFRFDLPAINEHLLRREQGDVIEVDSGAQLEFNFDGSDTGGSVDDEQAQANT